ncbi:MAG: hypothetical protein ACLFTP_12720 [Rhodosalinus sp.]
MPVTHSRFDPIDNASGAPIGDKVLQQLAEIGEKCATDQTMTNAEAAVVVMTLAPVARELLERRAAMARIGELATTGDDNVVPFHGA